MVMVKPRWKLTFYRARVRVVTDRDYCSVTTCIVPITFNSLSCSRWQIYNDCKTVAMLHYPDTTLEEFEIVKISEIED